MQAGHPVWMSAITSSAHPLFTGVPVIVTGLRLIQSTVKMATMTNIRRLILAFFLAFSATVFAATPVTVYKSPTCGCCEAYISYLKQNGFDVKAINSDDMDQIKKQLGVTPGLGSCHTAKIDGYIIEGHVPVAAIKKLLATRPHIVGISAPGMPLNGPGMGEEKPGTLAVYTMTRDQRTGVLFGRF